MSGTPPGDVLAQFGASAEDRIERLDGGWTNDTYFVEATQPLVVQRLSDHYFERPLAVMENLVRVTSHLDWKRKTTGGAPPWYRTIHSTERGRPFTLDGQGSIWRCFDYVAGDVPSGSVPPATAASLAAVYARFVAELDDLGGPPLEVVVDKFHDLGRVRSEFATVHAASADPSRAADVDQLLARIDLVCSRVEELGAACGLDQQPVRVVHNDTKLSNVIVDPATGEAAAVLDLDLAMPGHVYCDFGDLVRSANRHRTEEPGAAFDLGWFSLVAEGYLSEADRIITAAERAALGVAPARICVELAIRYFADHLRPQPRLRLAPGVSALGRGEENLRHAEQMLEVVPEMQQIVDQIGV